MTLGGMVEHLAYVEDSWFSQWLHGREPEPPWAPTSSIRSGRTPLPGPAAWLRRRWPAGPSCPRRSR
ncbi:MAG TPA: hypothetical protein VN748_00280 [Pseudonocardiaceae bacterium]|nr:hypothetical protein [Pseudonocardiaceae bacterium]